MPSMILAPRIEPCARSAMPNRMTTSLGMTGIGYVRNPAAMTPRPTTLNAVEPARVPALLALAIETLEALAGLGLLELVQGPLRACHGVRGYLRR